MQNHRIIVWITLAALIAAVPLLAQTSPVAVYATAASTGMVGLAAGQAAQLNVVNLGTYPATTAPTVPCAVQLEFWDAAGKMLKSGVIVLAGPGSAGALQYDPPAPAAASAAVTRTEIRGVVRSNPIGASATGSTGPYSPGCGTLMTTLELYDRATGVTQLLTSDTRPLRPVEILPPVM